MVASKKSTFIALVILLSIFVPCTVLGVVGKFMGISSSGEDEPAINTNKEFLFNNKLNFYIDGVLISEFPCADNYAYCGYAKEAVDDGNYSLNFYNDNETNDLKISGNTYTFVQSISKDPTVIPYTILYSIKDGRTLVNYTGVKNYTVGIEDNIFIVKDGEKWGAVSIGDSLSAVLDFKYDYIGLQDVKNSDGQIVANEFVVLEGTEWSIIGPNNIALSTQFEENIVAYNGSNVITMTKDEKFKAYTYSGDVLLYGNMYEKLEFVGKHIGVYDDGKFYVFNMTTGEAMTQKFEYSNSEDITIDIEDSTVIIKYQGNVIETITL